MDIDKVKYGAKEILKMIEEKTITKSNLAVMAGLIMTAAELDWEIDPNSIVKQQENLKEQ